MIDFIKSLPNQTAQGLEWLNHKDAAHQYPYYKKVFEALRPKTLLEIGTYLGYSLATAGACENQLERIQFVDNESYLEGSNALAQENFKYALQHGARAGDESIKILLYNFLSTSDPGIKRGHDLAHIDGGHSYNDCYKDLEFVFERDCKHIIGHDYLLKEEGVKDAVVDFCNRNKLFHAVIMDFTHGLYLISEWDFWGSLRKLSEAGIGPILVVPPL